jgi:hypothetical protein
MKEVDFVSAWDWKRDPATSRPQTFESSKECWDFKPRENTNGRRVCVTKNSLFLHKNR